MCKVENIVALLHASIQSEPKTLASFMLGRATALFSPGA